MGLFEGERAKKRRRVRRSSQQLPKQSLRGIKAPSTMSDLSCSPRLDTSNASCSSSTLPSSVNSLILAFDDAVRARNFLMRSFRQADLSERSTRSHMTGSFLKIARQREETAASGNAASELPRSSTRRRPMSERTSFGRKSMTLRWDLRWRRMGPARSRSS